MLKSVLFCVKKFWQVHKHSPYQVSWLCFEMPLLSRKELPQTICNKLKNIAV